MRWPDGGAAAAFQPATTPRSRIRKDAGSFNRPRQNCTQPDVRISQHRDAVHQAQSNVRHQSQIALFRAASGGQHHSLNIRCGGSIDSFPSNLNAAQYRTIVGCRSHDKSENDRSALLNLATMTSVSRCINTVRTHIAMTTSPLPHVVRN